MESEISEGGLESQKNKASIKRLILFSELGCYAIVFLSVTVLIGWIFHIRIFQSILPGYHPMNPLEAISFISLSIVLLLRSEQMQLSLKRLFAINILTIFVLIIAVIACIGTFFPPLSIMIAPNSATNLILLSIALFAFNQKNFQTYKVTQFLTLIAGLISMFAGIGYLYNVLNFYQFSPFNPMPLNTACAFALLCICILLSTKNYGIMKILTDDLSVSNLARHLIIVAIVLPVILGAAHIFGQHFLPGEIGTALMVISQIVISTIIIWVTTNIMYKDALEKRKMRDVLQVKNNELNQTTTILGEKTKELTKANEKIRDLLNHEQRLQDRISDDI